MIRPIGRMPSEWIFPYGMRLARSGTSGGALGRQLSALVRRRRLRKQQQELQAGVALQQAIPPYPLRPRPPS
jgi:hypothetical protein